MTGKLTGKACITQMPLIIIRFKNTANPAMSILEQICRGRTSTGIVIHCHNREALSRIACIDKQARDSLTFDLTVQIRI